MRGRLLLRGSCVRFRRGLVVPMGLFLICMLIGSSCSLGDGRREGPSSVNRPVGDAGGEMLGVLLLSSVMDGRASCSSLVLKVSVVLYSAACLNGDPRYGLPSLTFSLC